MKRLALAAAVLSIVACSSQEEAPIMDSATAPAMAPAPAAPMDSMPMTDTTMMDTTMTDTTVTPPPAQ